MMTIEDAKKLQGKTIAEVVDMYFTNFVLKFTDGTHLYIEATTTPKRDDWTGRDVDCPLLIVSDKPIPVDEEKELSAPVDGPSN